MYNIDIYELCSGQEGVYSITVMPCKSSHDESSIFLTIDQTEYCGGTMFCSGSRIFRKKNVNVPKSFDSCQPAHSAQADMG